MAKRFDKAREYTKKYKNMLLPCKVCGNKEITITSDIFCGKYYWCVNCSTKGCNYCSDTSITKVIKKWNEEQSGNIARI